MKDKFIGKFRRTIHFGEIEGTQCVVQGEYTGDLPPDGYIPLFEFLRLTDPKITVKATKETLLEMGYTSFWVYVEDNDDYWAYTNHKCNTCTKKCKQSSKVELLACPQYEEIK